MSIVKVDQEKCIGCGACVAINPENFDFNDEGISTVINEIASEKSKEAEEACPVLAIDIVEEKPQESVDDNTCECEHCQCDDDCDCECSDDGECDCQEKHKNDIQDDEDENE